MRSPRVLTRSFPLMSAVFTVKRFRTVIGLRLVKQSYPRLQPLYGFCPSDQSFASAFLQIPPRDGHPWLWLYPSHCRADSGLSPVRACSHKGIDDKSKIKKGQKDDIEFVITGENAAESLETAKKSFNLIALFV